MIDLLVRYMQVVIGREGVDFLDLGLSWEGVFTDAELEQLRESATEARRLNEAYDSESL